MSYFLEEEYQVHVFLVHNQVSNYWYYYEESILHSEDNNNNDNNKITTMINK